jgi:membrane protease YdiL (CAAX protease family)
MGLLWRKIQAEEPAPPWGLLSAVGIVIGAFACIVLGAGIVGSFGGQSTIGTLLAYSIGMGFAALLVTVTRNRTPADGAAMAIGASNTRVPLLLMLSFGVGATLDLLALAIVGQPLITAEIASAGGPVALTQAGLGAWILAAFLLLALQPVAEGLVFRGVAYPALRHYLGPVSGFFMSAAWHGIFHLVAYSTTGDIWITLISPMLVGVYLNGVRVATGSTRAAIIAHAGLGVFFIVRAVTVVSG